MTRWFAVAVTLGGMASAWGDAGASRYVFIPERNPFSLRPPVQQVVSAPQAVVPPAPLATVELTGVTSILSKRRALLEIIPGPGKQMIKPILSEGESVETVELVSIDIEKAMVTIKNSGILTNLPLKVAKATIPTPPPPVGRGGIITTSATGITPVDPGTASVMAQGPRVIPSRMTRSGLPSMPNPTTALSAEASVIEIEHNRRINPASFPPLPTTVLTQ